MDNDNDSDGFICPHCKGKLLPSRKWVTGNVSTYWLKPWGGTLKMSEPVECYACMSCGKVSLFLKNKSRVLREYDELPEEELEDLSDR